ncbi:MAG: hypothetical protein VW683_14255 [Betaproteobacteria bacterium]
MAEQIVTDVGDINKNVYAEVKLLYNAITIIPGVDGVDCDNPEANLSGCAGNRIFRSATRSGPPVTYVQPNDSTYMAYDIWVDEANKVTYVLLPDDETGDGCAEGESYDTDLAQCVVVNEPDYSMGRRIWRQLAFDYTENIIDLDGGVI